MSKYHRTTEGLFVPMSTADVERQFNEYLYHDCSPEAQRLCKDLKTWDCYRLHNTAGHYRIFDLEDNGGDVLAGNSVTLKMMHGADSKWPGIVVTGVEVSELRRCGCGDWEWASESQKIASELAIAEESRRRNN